MSKARRKQVRREVLDGERMLDVAHEAMVAIDGILEGRIHQDGERDLRNEIRRLMKISLELHRKQFVARWKPAGSTRGWTGKLGLYVQYSPGEHHYICMYCLENIESRSNGPLGGAKILAPTMARFETHAWTCAMTYLAERGGLVTELLAKSRDA
jgi:hypothetical protein